MINKIISSQFLAGLTATVAFTGVIVNAGIANALMKTYTDTFELAPTDITDALLSVQKFDGSLGTLQNVTVGFDGQIIGNARVESEDAEPQTLTFNLSGILKLVEYTDTIDNLFEETVSTSDSFDATAYDGTLDFGGTSGKTFEGLTATFNGENVFVDQTALDFFTGADNVDFLFSTSTTSRVTGAANITSSISTKAGATVTVTYKYDDMSGGVSPEPTPEPAAILGLGLFAGVGILSKNRSANKA